MSLLTTIEADLSIVWKIFTDCLYAVLSAEENLLWADAVQLFKTEGVAIQNTQPGISTSEFISLLVANATPLLVGDLKGLGTAAKTVIAATIAHDLAIIDGGGNAGVVSSSNTSTSSSGGTNSAPATPAA